MAVFKSLSGYYLKSRPGPHRLEGITTKRHPGFVLARLPHDYPMTSQQRKVKEAAKACGIHTGMSRSALVNFLRLMRVISYRKLLKFGGSLKWLYRANPENESGKCVENRWGASTMMDDGMFQSAMNQNCS